MATNDGRKRPDDAESTPLVGPIRASTERLIASLHLDEAGAALAALALTLADTLDAGAGLATAGISRELRAVLADLKPADDGGADDLADLSAPLEYAPQP